MKTNTILYFKKKAYLLVHTMEQRLDMITVNQSRMCPTYWRTDGWNATATVSTKASTKEKNTTKVLSCSMFVQNLSVHSSEFPFQTHTHTHTRQQLLADGMEGFYRHMLTVQKPVGSRTVSERSQTERRVGFISPVRSSLPPFHISTASTFLLWRLLPPHLEPKHKQVLIKTAQ